MPPEIVPPENEVFDEDDCSKHGCPIPQEREEVGQRVVEPMGPRPETLELY
jgi:hypothetical protein